MGTQCGPPRRSLEADLQSGWLERIPVAVLTLDISALVEGVGALLRDRTAFDLRIELEGKPELLRELMAAALVVESNAEALRLVEASEPCEVEGPLSRLMPPEADLVFLDMILGLNRDEVDFDAEIPLLTLKGNKRYMAVRARVLSGFAGQPYLAACFFDVTPRHVAVRRLAEESEDLSAATWQTDAEGSITHPQPAWEAFTGQGFGESRMAGWTAVIHPDDREQAERLWERAYALQGLFIARGRMWRGSYGTFRRVVVHAVPVIREEGTVNRWHWIAIDVDDRLRAAELERSNRDLEQFAFVAAHDLKAPLRTLTMTCDLFRERFLSLRELVHHDHVDIGGVGAQMLAELGGALDHVDHAADELGRSRELRLEVDAVVHEHDFEVLEVACGA